MKWQDHNRNKSVQERSSDNGLSRWDLFLQKLVAWLIVAVFMLMGAYISMQLPIKDPTNWPYAIGGGVIVGALVGYFITVLAEGLSNM